ncbi:B12-binding domain-containing radical SAM protein [Chrysiogenes arsenatis]|uniref:B12-binding domain-containing radical SAM protein n=1 Tax=Chrysiogenes arsenatis TaxID=309797 RepID=UPI000407CB93|nr:radical SAM protein [Chrysiogenes arsenatis]
MKLAYDRILLVHPLGYNPQAAGRDISRMANLMPPLGLASIAAWLEKRGLHADLLDCYATPDTAETLLREQLLSTRPAWIGFSCTTSSFLDGVRLSQLVKSILPGIRSVFGGPHISALKTEVLERFPDVDYAIVGEGEEAIEDLMLRGLEEPATVGGLVWRDGEEIRFNGYRKSVLELDAMPFPAYEKLHGYPHLYKLPIFNYPKAPNSSCISSRGCPYSCSYCDRSVFGRSFRYNSATYLYEHLAYLRRRFGIRHINFYDDQFTFHRQRVEEFCQLLLQKPLGMTFNCAVRAEHVDPPLLKLMKAAGCWMVSLGIETGDPELLARHRQNADLDMLATKIRHMKGAGIRVKGLLMMGLPGESRASIQRSMDYVRSLPIDDFNLSKFTPFPGSPIYQDIQNQGIFHEDWAKMDCMHFLFIPHGMEKEELEALFTEYYKRHYTRPSVLLDYVTMLWRSPDSWRRFLLNFKDFAQFARSNRRLAEMEE